MPPRRLTLAFAASLLLHLAALGGGLPQKLVPPAPAPALRVALRLPSPPAPAPTAEPLLKNTLDEAVETPREEPPSPPPRAAPEPPKPSPVPRPADAEKRQVREAQRKLNAHTFYPEEAIARGLEGDVRVILVLADDGAIADVQVAASSGHALLDNAAVRAAWAMGRLPGATVRQMILPVSFRLR